MSRPSLALIHGWGLGRQAWAPVIPALSAHLDIHLVDLPGYASAPPDPACFALPPAGLPAACPRAACCAAGHWARCWRWKSPGNRHIRRQSSRQRISAG